VTYPFWLTKLLVRTRIARALPAVRRLTDGAGDYLHYYSDRVLSAPLADLQEAAAYREVFAPDAIDLNLGSPRLDLVPSASTKLPADRRGCPPANGLPELRALIADRCHADPRLGYSPVDEVLVTHGGAGAFAAAVDAFVNPGDRVVLFDPSSPLFPLALRHRRARLRFVPTWVEKGQTRFYLEPFARAMKGAKLLVLADPANPTGGTLAPEDLEQVAWWANRHDVLVYCDGAFGRFRYDGPGVPLAGFPGAARRTLTAGSLSKGHGLAAARVGWLVGFRHLVRPCLLTATLSAPFVPTVCQQIALAALRQGDEAFAPVLAEFAARRRYAFERLRAAGLEPAWPSGGFTLWAPVGHLGLCGREFTERLLRAKKVLVGPGELFGPGGAGFVRISYAADDGRLREGLSRLAEFVEELRRPETEPAPATPALPPAHEPTPPPAPMTEQVA
jgi:aspartate/methionine/tyrosine aminotransferase